MPVARLSFFERLVFYLLLSALIAPIWSFPYFLAGDGPCHLYNSRVLLDFWQERNVDFFDQYFFTNRVFNPNWFSHFCLAVLQMAVPGVVAEKILLTGYFVLFALGLRFLLRRINPNSTFLSIPGMLLAMHYLVQAGFYNYAFSIAMFFWVSGYWLHIRRRLGYTQVLALAFLWLVLYFMHPIGLVFSVCFAGLTVLAELIQVLYLKGLREMFRLLRERLVVFMLVLLPVILRFSEYVYFNDWGQGFNTENRKDVFQNLKDFSALATLSTRESDIAFYTGRLLALLALVALALRIRSRRFKQEDYLAAFFGLALFYFFYQTGAHSIELMMPIRLQIFPWLGLLLWVATADFPGWAKTAVIAAAVLLMGLFLSVRWPVYREHSKQVEKIMQCLPHIDDKSVVLVLNYNRSGPRRPDGQPWSDKSWNFMHAADYIGMYRTVIMSDNFEALRNYFPLGWRWQRDLYNQTKKDEINFENQPPRADFIDYTRRTGGAINYVLLLGLDDQSPDRSHPYTREILEQLDKAYNPKFETADKDVRLYRIKG